MRGKRRRLSLDDALPYPLVLIHRQVPEDVALSLRQRNHPPSTKTQLSSTDRGFEPVFRHLLQDLEGDGAVVVLQGRDVVVAQSQFGPSVYLKNTVATRS